MLSIILGEGKEERSQLALASNTRAREDSPSGVSDPEASGLDSSNSSGSDDKDTLLLGEMEELSGVSLGDSLSDEGNGLDLKKSEGRTERGKVSKSSREVRSARRRNRRTWGYLKASRVDE